MSHRRIGVFAGVVSVLGLVVQHVPSIILDRWVSGGFEGAVPMVGTIGQSVVVYSAVAESVGLFVTFLLAIGLGYFASHQFDMGHEYRRFGEAVAVGSLLGVASIWAVLVFGVQSTPMDSSSVLMSMAIFVRMVATVSLVVTVSVFAGAALSHFRTNEGTPAQPTDTGTDSPSKGARESVPDDSDAHSSTV